MFITVDTETWDSLAAPDREAMLAEIGTVAEGAGYTGAAVRKTDGIVVGRWLRSSGARLVDPAP